LIWFAYSPDLRYVSLTNEVDKLNYAKSAKQDMKIISKNIGKT